MLTWGVFYESKGRSILIASFMFETDAKSYIEFLLSEQPYCSVQTYVVKRIV